MNQQKSHSSSVGDTYDAFAPIYDDFNTGNDNALEAASLRCLTVKGQREDGGHVILEEPADEAVHCKMIYAAGHSG